MNIILLKELKAIDAIVTVYDCTLSQAYQIYLNNDFTGISEENCQEKSMV